MPTTEITRPNYYEGQYLGAQDLVAAQEYQRQQDQRHRLAAHTWGIAVGLELEERPQPGSSDAVDVYVKPGYAVDGFGRATVVLTPYKISETLFAQFTFDPALPDGRWISVWLRYREQKTNLPRPGFAVCDVGDQVYRILETFRVVVGDIPSITQQHDQISVGGQVVDAESEIPDASVPYQALPESGDAARWLIRLGSVRWLAPNPPATTTGHFVKSESDDEKTKAGEGRPYVGVVAENVLAPAGKLRIRDRHNKLATGFFGGETQDLAAVEGSLRVDGDLHIRGGKVGVGTMAPEQSLSITAGLNVDQANVNDGKPGPGITFGSQSGEGIASKRTSGGNEAGLDFYTGASARLSITNDGRVGIGTTNPGFKLDVAGEVHATNFPSSSDARLKTNITPISDVLEKVRKMRGVSFDWNEKYAALGRSTNKRELGVLANEVQALFPELVSTWGDENYLAVDYGRLTAVLLEAVKELTSEIDALRGRIVALEKPAKKPGRKSNDNPLG
jgi:hypothetical protein